MLSDNFENGTHEHTLDRIFGNEEKVSFSFLFFSFLFFWVSFNFFFFFFLLISSDSNFCHCAAWIGRQNSRRNIPWKGDLFGDWFWGSRRNDFCPSDYHVLKPIGQLCPCSHFWKRSQTSPCTSCSLWPEAPEKDKKSSNHSIGQNCFHCPHRTWLLRWGRWFFTQPLFLLD